MTKPTPTSYPDLGTHLGATKYREIHLTAQPDVVGVLSRIDGYTANRRAVVTLASYAPQFAPAPPDPLQAMTQAILDAVDDDRPIPEVLTDVVPDLEAFRRHNALAQQAAFAARESVAGRLDTDVERHLFGLRAAIADGLVDVVERAREVTAAGEVPVSADAAIESGRVEDYQAVRRLESAYVELQVLHVALMRAENTLAALTGNPLSYAFFVANPLEVFGQLGMQALLSAGGDAWRASESGLDLPESWTAGAAIWWWTRHRNAVPWAAAYTEVQTMLAESRPARRQPQRSRVNVKGAQTEVQVHAQ